jgi:hypothetical protein
MRNTPRCRGHVYVYVYVSVYVYVFVYVCVCVCVVHTWGVGGSFVPSAQGPSVCIHSPFTHNGENITIRECQGEWVEWVVGYWNVSQSVTGIKPVSRPSIKTHPTTRPRQLCGTDMAGVQRNEMSEMIEGSSSLHSRKGQQK